MRCRGRPPLPPGRAQDARPSPSSPWPTCTSTRSEAADIPLGNIVHVRLFALIAFFIALIAGVNFVNLATARAEKRARLTKLTPAMSAMKNAISAKRRTWTMLPSGMS